MLLVVSPLDQSGRNDCCCSQRSGFWGAGGKERLGDRGFGFASRNRRYTYTLVERGRKQVIAAGQVRLGGGGCQYLCWIRAGRIDFPGVWGGIAKNKLGTNQSQFPAPNLNGLRYRVVIMGAPTCGLLQDDGGCEPACAVARPRWFHHRGRRRLVGLRTVNNH